MAFYVYVFLLLIMLIMLFRGAILIRFLSDKIKVVAFIIIGAMLLRYTSIFIMYFSSSMKYLYLLKVPFFLNLLSVPIIVITVLYIFVRKDNVKFYYIFIITAVLCAAYAIVMYKCEAVLQNLEEYKFILGYTLVLSNQYIYWGYLVFNTLVIFFVLGFVNKTNANKLGIYMVLLAACITISELIAWLMGIRVLAENVLGDVGWIVVFIYALSKVKKTADRPNYKVPNKVSGKK
ncbi:hypothetical protein [Clostridium autoethanogenum]|uniref:Uncharacterized protein n=2 Tax=Clostridium autoethanogenum TaxID=84023 RepID=A0A3M0T2J7_9CLOT|nr:hypothetical protein [Clostridium autoethanogenum]AGY76621.1 hypothetical protein CAETHG_2410 [Clostridium autoethanogenum DSM 10061]ALU36776.1 Hypothetical protein CLAU_2348 [Clostridium autoethanogenum DSM 10061]OVY50534.1 hypothetical protein WX72_02606 [Clostridium autoethanogenum]RMD04853.1 hypothetical protein D9O40_00435 [Clostridium autoethanogenum]